MVVPVDEMQEVIVKIAGSRAGEGCGKFLLCKGSGRNAGNEELGRKRKTFPRIAVDEGFFNGSF